MKVPQGSVSKCLVFALVGLPLCAATASAEGSSASAGAGRSPLEGPLVVSGSQSLLGGESVSNAEEARLASPEAAAAREESQTKYEGLSNEESAKLAGEAFPAVIDDAAGGPPPLPAGERLGAMIDANAAQVQVEGGESAALESVEPIALESSPGHWSPIDLSLSEAGGAFRLANPAVDVSIPKRLQEGVSLTGTGVSSTPVNASGVAVGGTEGRIDGAVVFYGGVAAGSDVDVAVKPTTFGFDSETFLRSVRSPEVLYFRVGMPQGASLVQAQGGSGVVQVVEEGAAIASVDVPSARDAAGRAVPVSMGVSGDILRLTVSDHSGEYQWPIEVDPNYHTNKDEHLTGYGSSTNWLFCTSHSSKCEHVESQFKSRGWGENGYLTAEATGGYRHPEYAEFIYQTQGESHVHEFTYNTEESNNEGDNLESSVIIENENRGGEEAIKLLSASKNASESGTLVSSTENYHNAAAYVQAASSETEGTHFTDTLKSATVQIEQPYEAKPVITMDTTDEYLNGGKWLNVLHGENKWMGPNSGAIGFTVKEKGIGVGEIWASYESGVNAYEQSLLSEGKCKGLQCPEEVTTAFTYNPAKPLPNGHDKVLMAAVGSIRSNTVQEPSVNVNVDAEKPHGLVLTGLPTGGVVGEAEYHVKAEATDGVAPTASAGIKSLVVAIDGYVLPGKAGTCTPGPCTVNGEWTINGEEFGAGKHTVIVQAIDYAGNEETKEYSITVRHAKPVTVGPGSVNPVTGALYLGATDVSIAGSGGPLSVARSYNSRQLSAGEEGPLGPQWSISVSGSQEIEQEPTGSVVLVGNDGSRTTFESNGKGGFISPKGDENLLLEAEKEGETIKAYLLKDPAAGTTVKYTQLGSGGPWVIASSEGPLSNTNGEKETFEWEVIEGITRPKRAIAAPPEGVNCPPTELKPGCRALEFKYATETTSEGEAPSGWKEYKGRLSQVSFTAYNPSSKEMKTTPVAEYVYDKQGRLRAEWDPRLSQPLKTIYGYDAEGHVTSLSPPGEQPWLMRYGTIVSEAAPGRLLSVTRPAASAELPGEVAPHNTSAPTLSSSTAKVGVKLSVASNGGWSESPLLYSYEWEDCNSSGAECTVIPGAVNQSYYPATSDEGHTLRVLVSAGNAGGSVSAASAVTGLVAAGTPNSPAPEPPSVGTSSVWTVDYQVPVSGTGAPHAMGSKELEEWAQKDDPVEATAVFPPDEPMGWPAANYTRASIYYLDGNGRLVNVANPAGGIATSEYNETNDVVRSLSADNRAAALKEGKAAQASEKLDTKSTYNKEGTELLETLGPEHKVKLEGGSEVQARNHVRYSYEDGLVVKTMDGAEISGEEERNVRVTTDSYAGQEGIGWKLRKPTSVTAEPKNGLEDQFELNWGSKGAENGEFSKPNGVAVAANGDVYVVDTANNRIQEFSSSGGYLTQFGKEGKENVQFKKPEGIAIGPNGDVYVADTGNSRIQILTESGGYVGKITEVKGEKLKEPIGVAVASNGDIYVLLKAPFPEETGKNYVYELNEKYEVLRKFGKKYNPGGCLDGFLETPRGIAVASNGDLYVADTGNDCIAEFNPEGESVRYFGKEGSGEGQFKEPKGVAVAPNGEVYVADTGNSRVEQFTENGAYLGQFATKGEGEGQLKEPDGIAVASSGVYIADTGNNRVQKWGGASSGLALTHATVYDPGSGNVVETKPPAAKEETKGNYTFKFAFGKSGAENGQFSKPNGVAVAANGDVYVVDTANNRIQEFSSSGGYLTQFGKEGKENVQFKKPEGIAIGPNGDVYVADTGNSRIQILTESGGYVGKITEVKGEKLKEPIGVAVASNGDIYVLLKAPFPEETGKNYVYELNEKYEVLGKFGKKYNPGGCLDGFLETPRGIAVASNGDLYVADTGNDCIAEFNPEGESVRYFGKEGSGEGQFKEPKGVAVAPNGDVYVADTGNNRVEEFSESGSYLGQFATKGEGEGQLKEPAGIAIAGNGDLWNGAVYVADTGNSRIENWIPPAINTGAHATQTIYYTAEGDPTYPQCNHHPEWANLPCQTQPAAQPEDSLPKLPVAITTYNMWDEPETTTETYGSTIRTKTVTYDAAGRELTSETTSSSTDASVPKVSYKYSLTTGALIEQSTTVGEKTETLTSTFNTLEQLVSYTNAAGVKSEYAYDVDGRVKEMNDGLREHKGLQTYTYNSTTGELSELHDPAGAFTASYDVEGKILTEGYPNGMTATYSYSPTSEATALSYTKTAHCGESCTWFSDSIVPSIHGEAMSQASTLSSETYAYDNAGRLTEVQETSAGKSCLTRLYAYDEESDRTSLTKREPGSKGECATEGGTVEAHSYDEADRLDDAGVSYEALGNTTNVPSTDAGGKELVSAYYADGQTASQKQGEETISYTYDPAGRTLETVSKGTTNSTVTDNYSGSGEAIAWSSEGSEEKEKWTRNIPGIDGTLTATQNGEGKTSGTVELQLHDLQGNIVATAGISETETKLVTTYNSTEFGVPTTGSPPKYSWLGAGGLQTELPSGASASDGNSYVPQLGRVLQTVSVVPPGSPDVMFVGAYVNTLTAGMYEATSAYAAGALERETARLKAAQEEAEREAAEAAAAAAGSVPEPEEGGAAEGEGLEYGDPDFCYASAEAKQGKQPGHLLLRGGYVCSPDRSETSQEDLRQISAEIQFCLQKMVDGKWYAVENTCSESHHFLAPKGYTGGFQGEKSCKADSLYRLWVWVFYWGPGAFSGPNPEVKRSKPIRCS